MVWMHMFLPRLTKQLLMFRRWVVGQPAFVLICPSPKSTCSYDVSLYIQLCFHPSQASILLQCFVCKLSWNKCIGGSQLRPPSFLMSLAYKVKPLSWCQGTVVSVVTLSTLSDPGYVISSAIASAGETPYSPNPLHLKAFLRTFFYLSAFGNLPAHISCNGQFRASVCISCVPLTSVANPIVSVFSASR